MISTGSAFSATHTSANCTPLRAPHSMPATSATTPAVAQTSIQMCLSGMPIESAAVWSSATARKPRPTLVRENSSASERHHDARDDAGRDVELADQHAGLVHDPADRLVADAEIEVSHVDAPDELRRRLR